MKKNLLLLISLVIGFASIAQSFKDPQLNKRMDEYLVLNKELKFEKIIDYVHPVLFTLAPKDAIIKSLAESFDNDQMKITIDSMKYTALSEGFKVKEAVYVKIDYTMKLSIVLKDEEDIEDEEFIKVMTSSFEEGFKGGVVNYNKTTKAFEVSSPSFMFAIKDNPGSEWMFLGYQENETFIKSLYPAEVIEHFKLIN